MSGKSMSMIHIVPSMGRRPSDLSRPRDRRFKWYLLVLITLITSHPGAYAVDDVFPDVLAKVRPSVVGVGTFLATRRPPASLLGTGFAIEDGTRVVTNFHVTDTRLEYGEKLVVFAGLGSEVDLRPATRERTDQLHDITILRIEGTPITPVRLSNDDLPREGTAIAFTGFPIGSVLGLYPVTHQGIVSAITPIAIPAIRGRELTNDRIARLRDRFDVIQLDATAYPGNSGSPLYRKDTGEVLGIINKVWVETSKEYLLSRPSAITYAIPIRFLKALIRSHAKQD